jgi:hypothetical protein
MLKEVTIYTQIKRLQTSNYNPKEANKEMSTQHTKKPSHERRKCENEKEERIAYLLCCPPPFESST